MRITKTTVKDLWMDMIFEMAGEHQQELATNPEIMQVNPAVDQYLQMEQAGILLVLRADDDDGLIGYSVNLVHPHLHYQHLMVAQNDLLFITKPHRKGRAGLKLMQATIDHAKEMGAVMMMWHAKQGTTLDKLLQRKGYAVQDVIYSREI